MSNPSKNVDTEGGTKPDPGRTIASAQKLADLDNPSAEQRAELQELLAKAQRELEAMASGTDT